VKALRSSAIAVGSTSAERSALAHALRGDWQVVAALVRTTEFAKSVHRRLGGVPSLRANTTRDPMNLSFLVALLSLTVGTSFRNSTAWAFLPGREPTASDGVGKIYTSAPRALETVGK
jgi:hypothetical protein